MTSEEKLAEKKRGGSRVCPPLFGLSLCLSVSPSLSYLDGCDGARASGEDGVREAHAEDVWGESAVSPPRDLLLCALRKKPDSLKQLRKYCLNCELMNRLRRLLSDVK